MSSSRTIPMKRRIDNNHGCGGGGGFQEDRRYAPPQKRGRFQTQTRFQPAPLYHYGSNNMSRVSNYGGDVIGSNSSNSFPFAVRNNDSSSQSNTNYQIRNPNPNPQSVPLPLPYRKLDDFESLPEWVPNRSNFPIRSSNIVPVNAPLPSSQAPVFTNVLNPMPMVSIVSQAMPQQPILSKELIDLLNLLNNNKEKDKENPSSLDEAALCLDFGSVNLNVRNESVIKSLYSDMRRQCSSCGVRFKCQEEHSKHMDWHARKNRLAKEATTTKANSRLSQKPKKSRDWFASESLWLSPATGATGEAAAKAAFGEKTKVEEKQEQRHTVPADENQKLCALCIEPLEEFFSHEEDDWLYRDAAYLSRNGSGPIVHVKCMPEPLKMPAKDSKETMVMPVTVPLVC
ncbi:unnamed protein product [Thlaspi arvense]|uniref:C2H2-type domain-containing protein n=1 Tax=Thlaspi arvense TaxID=13288 RepID=A0AAU9SDV7_THLAR|nr:unnamed protein product [Thlaspi arvense]